MSISVKFIRVGDWEITVVTISVGLVYFWLGTFNTDKDWLVNTTEWQMHYPLLHIVKAWRPSRVKYTLQWHHNGRDDVSNHQPHHCLLNRLFRRRSKKASKPRYTGLCMRGIHRWPVNSPHKWQVTWKMFPFNDVIIRCENIAVAIKKQNTDNQQIIIRSTS